MTTSNDRMSSDTPASFSLKGKVALVTGGTKGIGKGIAIAMAGAGADVIISGRDEVSAKKILDQLNGFGVRSAFVAGDLENEVVVGGLIDAAIAKFGQLDILVNNAGVGPETPAVDVPLDEWRRVLLVNLEVPFRLAQAAGRHFIANGGGAIINVTSVRGQKGAVEESHYIAAKHGLNGLTKALAHEWASKGVRVNALAPGLVLTEMTQHWQDTPGLVDQITSRYPAKRAGYPRDMGGLAVFLASEAADFLHGQVIAVDGGLLA